MSVHFACHSWLGAVLLGAHILHLLFCIDHFTDFMEQRETACRINPSQLIITVHYNTAYPITWFEFCRALVGRSFRKKKWAKVSKCLINPW